MRQLKQLLSTLLLIWPCLLFAEGAISFEAYVDAKQVVLNSYFEVSFTLKNADGGNFSPPRFTNFQVLSGPNRSSSTTIVNGQVSREISLSYTLRPKKVGKFTVRSASIKVGGKTLKTKPFQIEVLKESSKGNQSDAKIIVKAIPNTSEARVGQQIILDYKLYTTIDIDSYNVIEESSYAGFFAKDIKRYDFRVVREVVDGIPFTTKIIKRVALYPQQDGLLTIDPMFLQMGIVREGSRNRRSLLFKQVDRVPVQTEAIQIAVKALPANAPASFTGAVGKYAVNTTLSRGVATTDDVVSLRLAISGDGDIKRVQAPKMNFPEDFEVYDPKVLDESTYESGEGIVGKKVIEYLLIPKTPGNYDIKPAFTYYDTDSAKYVTLSANIHPLNVKQGSRRQDAPIITDNEEILQEDIRYIKTDTQLQKVGQSFFASPLFWAFSLFPFLILGFAVVAKQRKNKLSGLDPGILKARRARKIAQKRLSTAEQLFKANDSKGFYDEISKAMLGYVCDKLRIPLSELTKDNVKEQLQVLKVEEGQIDSFIKIIQTAEMALFAGKDNAAAMEETYEATINVLASIENSLS